MSNFTINVSGSKLTEEELAELLTPYAEVEVLTESKLYPINLMIDGDLIDEVDISATSEEEAIQLALLHFKSQAPYFIEPIDGDGEDKFIFPEDIVASMIEIDR